jgi:hypothetical protein
MSYLADAKLQTHDAGMRITHDAGMRIIDRHVALRSEDFLYSSTSYLSPEQLVIAPIIYCRDNGERKRERCGGLVWTLSER